MTSVVLQEWCCIAAGAVWTAVLHLVCLPCWTCHHQNKQIVCWLFLWGCLFGLVFFELDHPSQDPLPDHDLSPGSIVGMAADYGLWSTIGCLALPCQEWLTAVGWTRESIVRRFAMHLHSLQRVKLHQHLVVKISQNHFIHHLFVRFYKYSLYQ